MRLIVAALLMATAGLATAEVKWDAQSYDWKLYDRMFGKTESTGLCTGINKNLKISIDCTIDHASFDGHFAKEKAKPKIAQRDYSTPYSLCGEQSAQYFYVQTGMGGFPKDCADCLAEIQKKLKGIKCEFSDDTEAATFGSDGVLTLKVTPKTRMGWVGKALEPQLPALKKFWDERR